MTQRGLSLIEVLLSLSVLALVGWFSVPSWQQYRANTLLQTTAQELMSAIQLARSEAIAHNAPVLLIPQGQPAQWHLGWRVFVDRDLSGTYSANDHLLHEHGPLPLAMQLVGNGMMAEQPSYLRYDASGFAKYKHGAFGATTLTLGFCHSPCSGTTAAFDPMRRIKIAATGRLRVCNPHTDASCTSSLD